MLAFALVFGCLLGGHALVLAAFAALRGRRGSGRAGVAARSSRATVPEDLQAALAKNTKAAAFFLTLNARNRFAVLWRVQAAKKPETRQRRIAEFRAGRDWGQITS